MSAEYLDAGKIASTHGVKGEVKIDPWCNNPEFLTGFPEFLISGRAYQVERIRVHKNQCVVKLEGIDDVNAAMCLKGRTVSIDRNLAELPEGSHFINDIIGFEVYDIREGLLGRLADVLTLPAQDVYVVKGERERLIPNTGEFVLSIDTDNRRINVKIIDGM